MNYIYDILLNFNYNLYDFFEWESNDDIIHIKKIPLLKFKSEDLLNFINKKVKFDSKFLNYIYKKTELFNKNIIINYLFLATNQRETIAIKLNSQGCITGYSKLLLDEEEETLEYSLGMGISKAEYIILENKKNNCLYTRNELNIKKYIYKELDKIILNKKYEKLKYLYLDCFNENINTEDIIVKFKEQLENNWDNVYIKIYNFFKMTTSKR